LICVGRILRSQGKTGEVKLRLYDESQIDLSSVVSVFLGKEGELKEYRIQSLVPLKRDYDLKLAGVDSLSEADGLAGLDVWLPEAALKPLGEGQYYLYELKDCTVVGPNGEEIGVVVDILSPESNPVLVLDRRGKEVLVPFHESICKEVNLVRREIRIDPPAGLLDLNEI
jgi:16S rRNA processing protein RimM